MIKKHQGLILYTLFNILDKGLIFSIPLIILFVFQDQELYNKIEYIYAVASLLVVFLDFGIKNYIFYGYKESNNKAHLLKENRIYINFLIYFYSFIIICMLFLQKIPIFNIDIYLYIFIFIRSLYSILIAFYSYYFRLIDKPSKIYYYSLSVTFLTITLIGLLYFFDNSLNLFDLFIFQALLLFIFMFTFKKLLVIFDINKFLIYVKKALSYSYPILINMILVTIINQFGKVYAYNFLSLNDMTTLAFIQRFSLLLVLIHSSLSGYFSKKLFIETKVKTHLNILWLYTSLLTIIAILIILFGYINNKYQFIIYNVDIYLLILLTISTLLWCFTAYGELYFNRRNKNKYIPLITTVGFIIFGIILLLNTITVTMIIYAMLFSNLVSLLYSIILLRQKKVLVL